jgi:glycosyltransferase involved in cell wall biosynthesis
LQEEYLDTDKPVNRIEPLVSVLVTTYQHAPFIRQCLDSILMQETTFPYEVIVGEDESTDGTREICIEYAERHPDRIRLFLRDRTLSRYQEGNRERGFNGRWTRRSARGQYIALCEGDDYWTDPRKLQQQVEFLEVHRECSMCYHNNLVVWEDNREEPRVMLPPSVKPYVSLDEVCFDVMPQTATVMYRSSLFSAPGPPWLFRTPIGDWSLYMILAEKGKIGYIPAVMSVYRCHAGGMWNSGERLYNLERILQTLCLVRRELKLDIENLNREIVKRQLELVSQFSKRGEFSRAAPYAYQLLKACPLRSQKSGHFIPRRRLLSVCLRGNAPVLWRASEWLKNRVCKVCNDTAGDRGR